MMWQEPQRLQSDGIPRPHAAGARSDRETSPGHDAAGAPLAPTRQKPRSNAAEELNSKQHRPSTRWSAGQNASKATEAPTKMRCAPQISHCKKRRLTS